MVQIVVADVDDLSSETVTILTSLISNVYKSANKWEKNNWHEAQKEHLNIIYSEFL